jgi:phenylpropionate dioxygenase-like ring-hydroxylating dioxygenase large terminal subunit
MTSVEEHGLFDTLEGASGANNDAVNAKVPFHMVDAEHVPVARYYSREFFELEKEKLWPHVWQMAAREEELPDPGDFVEYEIVGNSILIIRQQDGSVKALHNACRHRGTELGAGSGRFPGGQIVCPFHGWRWNINGQCSHVFGREGFSEEVLQTKDIALRECLVETWAGHVWINMDLNAPPLMEALSPANRVLDMVGASNWRVKWWKEVILNCNWKLAQEAFFEGYHLKATHPQLYRIDQDYDDETDWMSVAYKALANGHGIFQSGDAKPSYGGAAFDLDFLDMMKTLNVGQDAMQLERDITIMEAVAGQMSPKDPAFPAAAMQALFEYWEEANIPAPPMTAEVMKMWGGDVHLFPNYIMLPSFVNGLAYRSRPYNDDPEWCRFELWSLTTYPVGAEPGRAQLQGRYDKDDTDNWGLIPRQDIANLERMQRGIRSQSMTEQRLSKMWEMTISNMHQELDRRLAAEY